MSNLIKFMITIMVYAGITLYIVLYVYLSWRDQDWIKHINSYLPLTIITLLIAYTAYIRAVDFLDTSSLPQLSDRCLATRTKDEEIIVEGQKFKMTYPASINEGGDAFAYEELIKIYKRSRKNFKKDVQRYLAKVSHNLNSAESYFEKVGIHRSKNLSWKYSQEGAHEKYEEYDIPSVISQLNEPNYWQTRATCAIFLRNEKYLKNINNFPEENLSKLKGYNWEQLFNNLIKNISSDSSLMVRKLSLDTYRVWACNTKNKKISTCTDFIKDEVYNFDKVVNHWNINKKRIVQTFKISLGIK